MTPYAREQHLAELAVLRASVLTKSVQSAVSEISKDDNSPVTIADFAAQALLIGALHSAFPNDNFLGEEDAAALRADEALCTQVYNLVRSSSKIAEEGGEGASLYTPASVDEMLRLIDLGGQGIGGNKGRFWVMDPIDGTAAFLRGQQYAVSLSLIEDGKEVVGVLGCPNISPEMTRVSEGDVDKSGFGVMLTAIRGQGSKIRIMSQASLGKAIPLDILKPSNARKLRIVDCIASTNTRHDVIAKVAQAFNTTFPGTEIWSSHIRYAALILGGDDVQCWVPTNPACKIYIWDHAGTHLIFTELGGKVTDLDDKDVDFGAGRDLCRNKGLVVAREDIHQSVLRAINEILEAEK